MLQYQSYQLIAGWRNCSAPNPNLEKPNETSGWKHPKAQPRLLAAGL